MKLAVYLEITIENDDALLLEQQRTSRVVSLLRAISLSIPHSRLKSLCGRLTSLQKVSLPLCKSVLLRLLDLILCCLLARSPPLSHVEFVFLWLFSPFLRLLAGKGNSHVTIRIP